MDHRSAARHRRPMGAVAGGAHRSRGAQRRTGEAQQRRCNLRYHNRRTELGSWQLQFEHASQLAVLSLQSVSNHHTRTQYTLVARMNGIMITTAHMNLRGRARESGVVLVIALIVLVAMTLVAIGTLRSVDTSNVVAGNLGFKQATLNGTDQVVETAYRYLATNWSGANLQNDAKPGYVSSVPSAEPDWTNPNDGVWGDALCVNGCAPDANGNTMYYVIHRMCTQSNTPYNGSVGGVANQCHMTTSAASGAGN